MAELSSVPVDQAKEPASAQTAQADQAQTTGERIHDELNDILKQDTRYTYTGKSGDEQVGMILYSDPRKTLLTPEHFTGVIYNEGDLKDVKIEGDSDGKRNITLNQYDQDGKAVAEFKGTFAEADPEKNINGPLQREVIVGDWTPLKGGEKKHFYAQETGERWLGPKDNEYAKAGVTDANVFERQVQQFRNAVLSGDKEQVAQMVQYPIRVHIRDDWQEMKDSLQFLKNYNRIFIPSYIGAIERAVPHHMLAKHEGVALGQHGAAWFNASGQVFSIHNDTGK